MVDVVFARAGLNGLYFTEYLAQQKLNQITLI